MLGEKSQIYQTEVKENEKSPFYSVPEISTSENGEKYSPDCLASMLGSQPRGEENGS